MIVNYILELIYNFTDYVVNKIPDVELPVFLSSVINTVSSYFSAIYNFLPALTLTLLAIIIIFLSIEGVILFIKISNWFIRKIPGIN
jgi:uncharacterized membrane protein